MLTQLQCPCGWRVSAQSVREASYALEQHAIYGRLMGDGFAHAMALAKLVERKPTR